LLATHAPEPAIRWGQNNLPGATYSQRRWGQITPPWRGQNYLLKSLSRLRPYFASCRVLATYNPPYHVQNDWTDIQIGVCTGPVASWRTLWPHLKYYG